LYYSRIINIDPAPVAEFIALPAQMNISCSEAPPAPTDLYYSNGMQGDCANEGFISSTIEGTFTECGGYYTETWVGLDQCNNPLFYSRIINIDPAPVAEFIALPAQINMSCSEAPPAPMDLYYSNGMQGDCANDGFITSTIEGTFTECGGYYTETWDGLDQCDNPLYYSRIITIDPAPPAEFVELPGTLNQACAEAPPTPTDLYYSNGMQGGCANEGFISSTIEGTFTECGGYYTETWDGLDQCDNTLYYSRIITIDPAPPAEFIALPAQMDISCSEAPPAPTDLYYSNGMQGDCANEGFITSTIEGTFTECGGYYTETWDGLDQCDNPLYYSRIINIDPAPVAEFVDIPENIIIECNNEYPTSTPLNFSNYTNGQCAIEGTVWSTISGEFNPCNGVLIENWTFTDPCGNQLYASREIMIFDPTPPQISLPSNNLTVECDGNGNTTDFENWLETHGGAQATDNCSSIIWDYEYFETDDNCGATKVIHAIFSAFDECGNESTTEANFSIIDTEAPLIVFNNPLLNGHQSGDIIDIQCYGMDAEWDVPDFNETDVIISETCDQNPVITFEDNIESDGNCPIDGYIRKYRLDWNAKDACGNETAVYIILRLVDTIPPVIYGVPNDTIIDCDSAIPNPYVFALDECECAELSYDELSIQSGCLDGQEVVRTWIATDCCGNTTSVSQTITIRDNESPDLMFIDPNIAGLGNGAILEYECLEEGYPLFLDELDENSIIGLDNCSNQLDIYFSNYIQQADYCEEEGYISKRVFNWGVIDECGNYSEIGFEARLVDNTPPQFIDHESEICTDDISNVPIVYGYDFCSTTITTHFDKQMEMPCGEGSYILRTYEAVDDCGNISQTSQSIYQNDLAYLNVKINNPALASVLSGDTLSFVCESTESPDFGPQDISFTDDCGSEVSSYFHEEVITEGECIDGIVHNLIKMVWTGVGICGINENFEIYVDLQQTEMPWIVDFEDTLYVECGEEIPEVVLSYNCSSIDIEIEEKDFELGICPAMFSLTRFIKLTDACGNVVEYEQGIIFLDEEGPIISGIEEEVCDDLSLPAATAFDVCMNEFVELFMQEEEMEGCEDGILIKRSWFASDICRNKTIIEQYISVGDTIPPTIKIYDEWVNYFLENPIAFLSDPEKMEGLNGIYLASVLGEDNCDPLIAPQYEESIEKSNSCMTDGYYENRYYGWSFSDNCDNVSSLELDVKVIDDLAPIIENIPEDITLFCTELTEADELIIFDHSPYTIKMEELTKDGRIYYRYWIIEDACGNITTHTQKIILENESDLSCSIEPVENIIYCNTHKNEFVGIANGGTAPYTYEWEALSGVCFLQGNVYNDTVLAYVGFTDINLQLTVTDANGCVTICNYIIHCADEKETLIEPFYSNGNIIQGVTPGQINLNEEKEGIIDDVRCLPNPANEILFIQFHIDKKSNINLDIYDIVGQLKYTYNTISEKGEVIIPVDLAFIDQGQYYVKLYNVKNFVIVPITVIK
jgi:hypothetical protein